MWLKQTLIALAFILPFGLLTLSNAGGRANVANIGNTGAPGDQESNGQPVTCSACHSGGDFNASLSIELLDGDGESITQYTPNTLYRIRVTVNASAQAEKYAMQMVALIDENNEAINDNYSNPSANTKTAVASSTGRTYVEQIGASNFNDFEIDWMSPESNTGSITFYSAGVAANSNGNTNGDDTNKTSFTITEMVSSTNNLENEINFTINNPITNELILSSQNDIKISDWTIYDLAGKVIISSVDLNPINQVKINTNSLSNGLHIIKINTPKGAKTIKFIKK